LVIVCDLHAVPSPLALPPCHPSLFREASTFSDDRSIFCRLACLSSHRSILDGICVPLQSCTFVSSGPTPLFYVFSPDTLFGLGQHLGAPLAPVPVTRGPPPANIRAICSPLVPPFSSPCPWVVSRGLHPLQPITVGAITPSLSLLSPFLLPLPTAAHPFVVAKSAAPHPTPPRKNSPPDLSRKGPFFSCTTPPSTP